MFYEKYWTEKNIRLTDFDLKSYKLKYFIPREGNFNLVDFGCGKGDILGEIIKINPNLKCIGLDVSSEALQKAKAILSQVDFKKIEDGGSFPVDSSSIDFVFSSEVMEHVYDTENAFKEISRILKPRGKFLITVAYHGFIKNLLITIFNFDQHFDPIGPHIRFFSKKTLKRELERVELTIVHCGYYGRFWPIPNSIFILAEKKYG